VIDSPAPGACSASPPGCRCSSSRCSGCGRSAIATGHRGRPTTGSAAGARRWRGPPTRSTTRCCPRTRRRRDGFFLMVGLAVDDRHEGDRGRGWRGRGSFEHGDGPGAVERVLERLLARRLLRQTRGPAGGRAAGRGSRTRRWCATGRASQSGCRRRRTASVSGAGSRPRPASGCGSARGKSALMDEVELREDERWIDGRGRSRAAAERRSARADSHAAAIASPRFARRQRFSARPADRGDGRPGGDAGAHRGRVSQGAAGARPAIAKRALENLQLLTAAAMEQGRSLLLDGHVRPMRALPYLVESEATRGRGLPRASPHGRVHRAAHAVRAGGAAARRWSP